MAGASASAVTDCSTPIGPAPDLVRMSNVESGASRKPGRARRWTLLKILVAIAVLATLGTVGVVVVRHSMHTSRVDTAIAEIEELQRDIESYYETHYDYPLSLDDVGHGGRQDPWGNPYEFLFYATVKRVRSDKNLPVLNSDYDLFSTGPDGKWKPALSSKVSRDDIIRANDGEFIGLAEKF